jgi:hypothetical protein
VKHAKVEASDIAKVVLVLAAAGTGRQPRVAGRPDQRERMASAAIRRWHSVGRRHHDPTWEIKVKDLADGLIAAVWDPAYPRPGPAKRDVLWLAERIGAALDGQPSG